MNFIKQGFGLYICKNKNGLRNAHGDFTGCITGTLSKAKTNNPVDSYPCLVGFHATFHGFESPGWLHTINISSRPAEWPLKEEEIEADCSSSLSFPLIYSDNYNIHQAKRTSRTEWVCYNLQAIHYVVWKTLNLRNITIELCCASKNLAEKIAFGLPVYPITVELGKVENDIVEVFAKLASDYNMPIPESYDGKHLLLDGSILVSPSAYGLAFSQKDVNTLRPPFYEIQASSCSDMGEYIEVCKQAHMLMCMEEQECKPKLLLLSHSDIDVKNKVASLYPTYTHISTDALSLDLKGGWSTDLEEEYALDHVCDQARHLLGLGISVVVTFSSMWRSDAFSKDSTKVDISALSLEALAENTKTMYLKSVNNQ